MTDNLFERLTDLGVGTGSKTPLAAIARIEELEAKLAKAVEALDKIKRTDNLVGVFAACERTIAELNGETE